jgi:hypothetical protein
MNFRLSQIPALWHPFSQQSTWLVTAREERTAVEQTRRY